MTIHIPLTLDGLSRCDDAFWVVAVPADKHQPARAVLHESLGEALVELWPRSIGDDGRPHAGFTADVWLEQDFDNELATWRVTWWTDRVELGRINAQNERDNQATLTVRINDLRTALRSSREGINQPQLQAVAEVEERTKLRHSNSGDYEGVLRRVEAVGKAVGRDKDTPPDCEVCKAYWPRRREGNDGRNKLFMHLCTAGHVALEVGLSKSDFETLCNLKQRGVPLTGLREARPLLARQPLKELVEGFRLSLRVVQTAELDGRIATKVAALAQLVDAGEALSSMLEDLEEVDQNLLATLQTTRAGVAAALAEVTGDNDQLAVVE